MSHPATITDTLGDELDEANLSWRFYASSYGSSRRRRGIRGRAIKRLGTSVTGPTGRRRHLTEPEFITDVRARASRKLHLDHAGVRRLRPRRNAAAGTDRRGLPRSSIRLARASSGIRPRSSCSGTIGADSTITSRRRITIGQPWLSRAAARSSRRTPSNDYVSHEQYETASVLRFAEDLFGLGQLAAADSAPTRPPQIASTSRRSRARS